MLDLVEEFYATLLLQDDKAVLAVDEAGNGDDTLTLYVSNYSDILKVQAMPLKSGCIYKCFTKSKGIDV